MARSKYRKEIECLIEELNNRTGCEYKTDFAPHYGGWNLYIIVENGGHTIGKYGFDYRISSKEMVQRLKSILLKL